MSKLELKKKCAELKAKAETKVEDQDVNEAAEKDVPEEKEEKGMKAKKVLKAVVVAVSGAALMGIGYAIGKNKDVEYEDFDEGDQEVEETETGSDEGSEE